MPAYFRLMDIELIYPQKQRLFRFFYPYVNLAFDATLIGYDIAYLFNRSVDYRPWHRLLGLKIQRRDQEDDMVCSINHLQSSLG